MVAEVAFSPTPRRSKALKGHKSPRIAPPLPMRSEIAALKAEAASLGLTLVPHQEIAGRYLMAHSPSGERLYREIAIQIARQNGKTTLLRPFITYSLRKGLRVLHLAHDRELPRDMFGIVADDLSNQPELFPTRRGKTIWPRYGSGQEEIILSNGGRYKIKSSRTGSARGGSYDIVIFDETRELEAFDVLDAALPTQTASADPLTVYLSNAGTDKSVVLNSLRQRAQEGDPNLAYLEWSAAPDREPGDRVGWAEANPALGHLPGVQRELEQAYQRALKSGNMAGFETEHLCRWVTTMQPSVIADVLWQRARGTVPEVEWPAAAVKVDPEGRRASVVIAWKSADRICVRSFAEDITIPLDLDAFAAELKPLLRQHRVRLLGYDPWTDRDLARHFEASKGGVTAKVINGAEYQAACERFVRGVEGGQIVHDDDGTIGMDLVNTVRREMPNGWLATRADPERPTTASEAAIRAVWLATNPDQPRPKVY